MSGFILAINRRLLRSGLSDCIVREAFLFGSARRDILSALPRRGILFIEIRC